MFEGVEPGTAEDFPRSRYPDYAELGFCGDASEEVSIVFNRPLELCRNIGKRIRDFRESDDVDSLLDDVQGDLEEIARTEVDAAKVAEYTWEVRVLLKAIHLDLDPTRFN